MLAVVEWYLTCFHQTKKVNKNLKVIKPINSIVLILFWKDNLIKKPYNPIIGETFNCSWKVSKNGNESSSNDCYIVKFTSEQLSHIPSGNIL
jgi:hypothetical protein